MENPRISVRDLDTCRDTFFYSAAEAVRYAVKTAALGRSVAISSDARNWVQCVRGVWKVRNWEQFYTGTPSAECIQVLAAFEDLSA